MTARAAGGLSPMDVTAIGLTPFADGSGVETTIDVSMIGCDLLATTGRIGEDELCRLEEELGRRVDVHLARRKALPEATVAGARGWIDGAALRVIEAAGADVDATLGALEGRSELDVDDGGEAGDLATGLQWRDGTVRAWANSMAPGAGYRLDGEELSVRKELPDTVVASLPGRRLREVVDLAIIPESALIVEVAEDPGWLRLTLEIDRRPFGHAVRAG